MIIEINTVLILILILILLLVLYKIMRKENNTEQTSSKINELETTLKVISNQLNSNITQTNSALIDNVNSAMRNTTESLDKRIIHQNDKQLELLRSNLDDLDRRINEQSKNTNSNIKEIVERVTRLDAIGENIVGLNENITNLEKVLDDKKARGTFGEIRLHQIFQAVFGEQQKVIYEEQYQLSNGKRVDFMLHAPDPLGNIGIDSKFPLDNYNKIINAGNDHELKTARRDFKQDIKKHINDIKDKYIIEGETAEQAIMFIPAESIFAEINGYHPELVNYSYENNVWITSPTTLMGMLNLLLVVLKDVRRSEQSKEIYKELLKLKEEFIRYEDRWTKFAQHFDTVNKDVQNISVTSQKITKRFNIIENVDFQNKK